MSDTLETWLAFRAGENPPTIHYTCTECGGKAEGNCSWADGSGEVCDKCNAEMSAADAAADLSALTGTPGIQTSDLSGIIPDWDEGGL